MTTYAELEASLDGGEPLELYEVTYDDTVIRLCSGDTDVTHAGNTFYASTIKRNQIMQSQEMNKALLTITTSKNNPIPELFRTGMPIAPIGLTVFRQHGSIIGSEYIVAYKGRIVSCRFSALEAEMSCEPIFTSLKRPGLRLKYEPSCVNGLYDEGSKAGGLQRKEAFKLLGTISATDGRRQFTISQAATKPNGYFVGGILVLDGHHMISEHVGSSITLMRYVKGDVGSAVALYPGCDHTRSTCQSRFNNIENYRGFPWMADRNPFNDSTINYIK